MKRLAYLCVTASLACTPSGRTATMCWTNAAGGNFSEGGNWDTGVPGPSDSALFDLDSATVYTVSDVPDGTANGSLDVGQDKVRMTLAGVYTLTNTAAINVSSSGTTGALEVVGGSISLSSKHISVGGGWGGTSPQRGSLILDGTTVGVANKVNEFGIGSLNGGSGDVILRGGEAVHSMKQETGKTTAGRQVAGAILSPDWVADPRRAEPHLREMAEHGYGVVDLFVRHTHRTHRDPAVHDAVKALCAAIQRRGMKCILDTDHQFWGMTVAEPHPEAALGIIGGYEAAVHEGQFEVRLAFPPCGAMAHGQLLFDRLVAAYHPAGGRFVSVPLSRIHSEWQNAGGPQRGVQLKGTVRGKYSGKLVLYASFRHYGLADVAHPRYLRAQKELLGQYADIPLDGFGWDEPGKGLGHPGFFKAGDGFLALFRRRNGYALERSLIWLDRADETPQAVKTRHDYHATLNEMNYRAQDAFNRHARKLFGEKKALLFGTHHTWSGLPTDLTGGVIDYFRLGRLLTAAWTDGSWDVETKYTAFHFMLADGIRKELGLRDAYYNDWTNRLPAVENMRFANRYKMLFNVNWFNIFFSRETESIVNYRLEPLKSAAKAEVAMLDRFDRLLEGRFQAYSPVACLYLWEGAAAAPKWLARAWYTAMANMAFHLADRGLFATLMSADSIRKGTAANGRFRAKGAEYQAVVVPYAHALPGDLYRRLMGLVDAGVPVVFFGPPPQFTTEGEAIGKAFARRVGMAPFTFADYQEAYAERLPLPAAADWEPETIDFAYPVAVRNGRTACDGEGHVIWVKAAGRPLYYLSQPDPREDLCNLLESLVPPALEAYAERTYYRLFVDPGDAARKILLAVAKGRIAEAQVVPSRLEWGGFTARKRSALKALFRLDGKEIRMRGGTWCAVKLGPGGLERVEGDCPQVG